MKPSANASQDRAALPAAPRTSARRWAFLALCLLAALGGAWVLAEFVLWNKLPGDLVGKWVVEGGDQDGATFDFYRSGAMVGCINVNGREGIVKATVKIEQDQLLSTTQNPHTGRAETRKQKIIRLSRTELVLQDERGSVLTLVRAEE